MTRHRVAWERVAGAAAALLVARGAPPDLLPAVALLADVVAVVALSVAFEATRLCGARPHLGPA